MEKLNLGNTIFEGFNDKEGIMLCGYEWGFSKKDRERFEKGELQEFGDIQELNTSFSNKINVFHESFPYDERIIKWFGIWGHPLERNNGTFEKCIIQTNWCDTQNPNMHNVNRHHKLLSCKENFLLHIRELLPKIIFFFGSDMIKVLNSIEVKPKFEKIVGRETQPLKIMQKRLEKRRRFKVGFQTFEKCEVISLPHPSGSRGVSDDYIGLFEEEIGSILERYKSQRSEIFMNDI